MPRRVRLADTVPTGRRYPGPTADLVERSDPGDAEAPLLVSIELHERYRRLPAVRTALQIGRDFLERPLVGGVLPLLDADPEAGGLLYTTGEAWSVAELLDDARQRRVRLGPRAAAELVFLAGSALVEAADAGAFAAVGCHGDVQPWRLMIGGDGAMMVIGYGLPELEAQRMRLVGADQPLTPSFRYAAPERMNARAEGLSADLYGLALIGAEVALGRPVLDGTDEALRHQAETGVARQRLTDPDALSGLLRGMLAPDPRQRPPAGPWLHAIAQAASDTAGPGLTELALDLARRGDRRQGLGRVATVAPVTATRHFDLAAVLRMLREAEGTEIPSTEKGARAQSTARPAPPSRPRPPSPETAPDVAPRPAPPHQRPAPTIETAPSRPVAPTAPRPAGPTTEAPAPRPAPPATSRPATETPPPRAVAPVQRPAPPAETQRPTEPAPHAAPTPPSERPAPPTVSPPPAPSSGVRPSAPASAATPPRPTSPEPSPSGRPSAPASAAAAPRPAPPAPPPPVRPTPPGPVSSDGAAPRPAAPTPPLRPTAPAGGRPTPPTTVSRPTPPVRDGDGDGTE